MDIDDFFKKRMAEHAKVRDAYDMVKQAYPDCKAYEKEPWTFLKLVVVGYYMDVYSNIAKKNFHNIAYFDLFAGPGINYIERLGLYVGGSPYLASNTPKPKKQFNDIILFELDQNKCKTLKLVVPEATVSCLDCNCANALQNVEMAMKRNRHCLAFVDPEGIKEIKWTTLENLFRFKGDVIINYPSSVVERQHGTFFGKQEESIRNRAGMRLTEFFGNRDWENVNPEENARGVNLFSLYLEGISKFYPSYEVIELGQERGGYKYHLIIATKKREAPWFSAVRTVKKMVSRVTFIELERFAAIWRGKQKRLTDYFDSG